MNVQQTIVHLHTPGQGSGIACGSLMPSGATSLRSHNHLFSGEPRAVNCPACKQSQPYKSMIEKMRALGIHT